MQCYQIHSTYNNACSLQFLGGDLSQIWPDMTQQFSKEIEDEANSYFQRIYNQPPDSTLSVDEVRLLKSVAVATIFIS